MTYIARWNGWGGQKKIECNFSEPLESLKIASSRFILFILHTYSTVSFHFISIGFSWKLKHELSLKQFHHLANKFTIELQFYSRAFSFIHLIYWCLRLVHMAEKYFKSVSIFVVSHAYWSIKMLSNFLFNKIIFEEKMCKNLVIYTLHLEKFSTLLSWISWLWSEHE